jgi:hypothetical protein
MPLIYVHIHSYTYIYTHIIYIIRTYTYNTFIYIHFILRQFLQKENNTCRYIQIHWYMCRYVQIRTDSDTSNNNVVGWSKPCVGQWVSQSLFNEATGSWGRTAAGPLDMTGSVPGRAGGPADSSSLESQPVTVMVRFQLEVHSGPGHAGDGRGWIRCSQCQADSSSHYDAGGRALSALRAGLILFSEPTIFHPPICHSTALSGKVSADSWFDAGGLFHFKSVQEGPCW